VIPVTEIPDMIFIVTLKIVLWGAKSFAEVLWEFGDVIGRYCTALY
jgi:hypothetical protein